MHWRLKGYCMRQNAYELVYDTILHSEDQRAARFTRGWERRHARHQPHHSSQWHLPLQQAPKPCCQYWWWCWPANPCDHRRHLSLSYLLHTRHTSHSYNEQQPQWSTLLAFSALPLLVRHQERHPSIHPWDHVHYLSASAVVIYYEEALYQVYAPLKCLTRATSEVLPQQTHRDLA